MREIICLHIGQAGVQMGNSIWELLSTEHGIDASGLLKEPSFQIESVDSFFALSHANKYVPRSIFVDLEATVIDEVRTGSYRKFFHPDRLVSGPEDAASNFARGFFTVGKLLLGVISHEIRKLLETGTCTNAIFIFRSLGGGTGSGLTSAIFDSLIEYPKLTKIEMPIYPSPTLSTAMVEPYNCLLSEHFCMEDIDVGLLIDNEALYDVCSKYLSISHASYNTINRLIGQLTSSITASVRFESVMNCDISVLQTNLVPYPRIHFPLANFAPVLSAAKAIHEELTVNDITRAVFEKENQMMKIDHSFGRFMSCCLLYRGDVSPYHVYIALNEIKRDKNIEFVDWCPTGFKVGINICPPTSIPESQICQTTKNVTMLANTSAIGQAWQRITHKFYLLYSKRSFVHWFIGEGMEECEFTESLYNISALVKDYEEVIGDNDNKPESNQQNQCVSDKANSSENPNQLNEMYMENTNLISGKGINDENESEFGKSCVKYQVSVSEPETAEVEEETNEEAGRNNYEYNENIEENRNESLNEEELEEVEAGEEEDEGEGGGEEVEGGEGGEEDEGGEEGEDVGKEGRELEGEVEEAEEENEAESTDFDKESEDENENCNVKNKKKSNINNCASVLESLFTSKGQSSISWRKTSEDSKFFMRKFNKKPMKKIYKKRIGNIQFHY